MPRSTIEVRLLVGWLLVRVAELSHGFVLKGSSGIDSSSEMSEITENVSMSDGVDGGLGTGDEEVGKDTDIKVPGAAGAAAKFASGEGARAESKLLEMTSFPRMTYTQGSVVNIECD